MAFKYNKRDYDRVTKKLQGLLGGLKPDLEYVGGVASVAIVQTTLAGIGEGDQPFAPYSPAYKELIDAVGGKPRQVVDLRGLFYHEGQKRAKAKTNRGQGRRAFVTRAFTTLARPRRGVAFPESPKLVQFQAMTEETRPQRGLTDKLSEMSLDLLKVEASDDRMTIVYEPRSKDYMAKHQKGDGTTPARPWFSANKSAVKAAMNDALQTVIRARVAWANDHQQSGPAPRPPQAPKPS